LAAGWGENVPEPLTKLAALRSSEQPLIAKDIARYLAMTIKALAKIEDPRIAPTILALVGSMPTYYAWYDEKSRVIRVKVSLPAVRAERVVKANMSIAYDPDLMRAKVSKKSLVPGTESSEAEISIGIRPEKLADQKLTAEVVWNLSGLEHSETIHIPIDRPTAP
jgi:hypothetical protein